MLKTGSESVLRLKVGGYIEKRTGQVVLRHEAIGQWLILLTDWLNQHQGRELADAHPIVADAEAFLRQLAQRVPQHTLLSGRTKS